MVRRHTNHAGALGLGHLQQQLNITHREAAVLTIDEEPVKTGSGKQFRDRRARQGNDRTRQEISLKQPFSKIGFLIHGFLSNWLLKNDMSAGKTRKTPVKKRRLWLINEYFESNFNAVWPSAIVFQQPAKTVPADRPTSP
jgi:hypothetical protein